MNNQSVRIIDSTKHDQVHVVASIINGDLFALIDTLHGANDGFRTGAHIQIRAQLSQYIKGCTLTFDDTEIHHHLFFAMSIVEEREPTINRIRSSAASDSRYMGHV